jgi:hypothetical protein
MGSINDPKGSARRLTLQIVDPGATEGRAHGSTGGAPFPASAQSRLNFGGLDEEGH